MDYHDSDGNRCSLSQLVRREPEWAANRIRQIENQWIKAEMILNAVGCALDGEMNMISDFEESFPIVRKAMDIYRKATDR